MSGFEDFQSDLLKVITAKAKESLEKDSEQAGQAIRKRLFPSDEPDTESHKQLSHEEKFEVQVLFSGFMEITGSYERLEDIEVYIGRFPFSNTRISKLRHLQYHIENYFSEVYVLKNRLITYLDCIKKAYKSDPRCLKVRAETKRLRLIIEKTLENLVNIRGDHVHLSRYEDPDLDRLSLFEVLSHGAQDEGPDMALKALHEWNYKDTRRKWKRTISKNNLATRKLLDVYFSGLHQFLFDGKGKVLTPKG